MLGTTTPASSKSLKVAELCSHLTRYWETGETGKGINVHIAKYIGYGVMEGFSTITWPFLPLWL